MKNNKLRKLFNKGSKYCENNKSVVKTLKGLNQASWKISVSIAALISLSPLNIEVSTKGQHNMKPATFLKKETAV